MPELLLLLAIALIVIGPKKLPDLAKSLGRAMREFKKATNEFKETIQIDEDLGDVKKAFNGLGENIKDSVSPKKDTVEFESPDKPESDENPADEKDKDTEDAAEDEKDDKLQKVKQAFDELKAAEQPIAEDQSESNAETKKEEQHQKSGKDAL
ncbi:MAG: twin-arginine translocase TatA/TatE family subunit [Deltaproteobacteria bacterium]